ncbi:MAG: metal-dependent hydrolase, partial [Bacteroidales bacterium]|nr:metal-dependent hydrolase [Bacteroidales bacterium]
MSGPNHIVGGTVFTGLFGSLMFGINILASPVTIGIAIVASLLPDIDHTRSTVGKIVYPLAKWINRKYGHRTITHGMPCFAVLTLLSGAIERTFFGHLEWTAIFALGYFSHLVLDMFTLQGVPLMYPFSRSPWVMIGNPDKRIRTGDYRKEAVAFSIFILMGMFLQPLFSKGFWTVWNQKLATLQHVHGEFLNSHDLLKVTYTITEGTNKRHGSGILIESKTNEAWLIDSTGQWVFLKEPTCTRAFPEHTGQPLNIQSANLINLTTDSLNAVLFGKKLLSIEVQANTNFQVTESGNYPKTGNAYTGDHLSTPPSFAAINQSPRLDTFINDRSYMAEIAEIQSEIQRIRADASQAQSAQRSHEALISNLRSQYAATDDITERQRLHDEIETALSSWKEPQVDESRTEALKGRIAKIRAEAGLKESAKETEVQVKNRTAISQVVELRLTGIITFLGEEKPVPSRAPMPQDTILPKTYRVIGVKDGDSIEAFDPDSSRGTKTRFVIRLAHVDCPE